MKIPSTSTAAMLPSRPANVPSASASLEAPAGRKPQPQGVGHVEHKPLATTPALPRKPLVGAHKPLADPSKPLPPQKHPMRPSGSTADVDARKPANNVRRPMHLHKPIPLPKPPVAGKPEPVPGDTATQPVTQRPGQPEPLSLKGLVEAWGQSDSPYDFDGDGTVNVNDLLFFINNWNRFNPPQGSADLASASPSTADAADAADTTSPANEVQAASDNAFTSVSDNAFTTASDDAFTTVSDNAFATASDNAFTTASDNALTTASDNAFTTASDNVFSTADPNSFQSATVARVHESQSKSETGGLNGVAARAALARAANAAPSPRSLGGLTALSDVLYDQLAASGFAQQPPINLPELVDAFALGPRQSQFLLKQLTQKYPDGLGVDMNA